MLKTATLFKIVNKNQICFKLNIPIEYTDYQLDIYGNTKIVDKHTYYVVSSKSKGFYETYLFASDSRGKITNYSELPGSQKEIYDFFKPLKNLDYEIIVPKAFKLLYLYERAD